MFQPVFLYDKSHPNALIDPRRAGAKGCRLIDVKDPSASIPADNPAVIVVDGDGFWLDHVEDPKRFKVPKHTGVLTMSTPHKGHVHGLAHPRAFVEWFFEEDAVVVFSDWLKGNFRLSYKR